ncbi:MAG: ribosome biogenesis GTP-binding protein YihA/YsxC [Flavobacteriaceae bacterium]|tara:strand:- start:16 stop:612 length:597 start_codon:yes stop_codon:yes gene_type:complete
MIHSARFLVSSSDVDQCPKASSAEYAFIGRSNVGKSSLINALTNNKKLAKTSGTPGKTKLINHFVINESWFLVDLPGYGYAKVSKKERNEIKKLIHGYFEKRTQLVNTFVLIDSRHKPQKIDVDFINMLGAQQHPFSIVFTKIDKLSEKQRKGNLSHYQSHLLGQGWESTPPMFETSAKTGEGKEEIINYIESINSNL